MGKKILLSNKYGAKPQEILYALVPEGFELLMLREATQEELESKIPEAEYILASGRLKINRAVLEKANSLKMIQRTGVGLDSLDLDALKEKNIPLYVNRGINAGSVAEHTVLLMLACLRKLPVISRNTKNGVWRKQEQGVQTRELSAQTVGIIGYGHIGRTVARLLKAFGAQVIYYDACRQPLEKETAEGVTYVTLNEMFARADIITLHCPLTEETRGIICGESIGRMKDGVIIINTARGMLIDENALQEALACGKVAFAGLDVYMEEPVKNEALMRQDHLIATPHIAGVTYDSFHRMMQEALHNIVMFDEGRLDEIEIHRLKL